MAKMGNAAGLRKIPLSQIVDTGNVREDYADIDELAESIKKTGQLEPVLVKALEPDDDGIERYELIAGHRRRMAFQKLCEAGEGFTNIDAIIVTGDKLTLQLVENLQRNDLTAVERERGIYQMCKNGLSQKEVAARLAKPEFFISRNVSAYKVREAAASAGVDTSSLVKLATGTLNEIQAAAPADYPVLVKEILANGGTLEVARQVMETYRLEHGKPANPKRENQKPDPPRAASGGLSDPLGLDPLVAAEFENDLPDYMNKGREEPLPKTPENTLAKPAPKAEKRKPDPRPWLDDFDPPHKQVDFNEICLAVMDYGRKIETQIAVCKKFNWKNKNEDDHGCECAEPCGIYFMHEAVLDIIALLHAGL
jgi:ParB family chromosome partitioning protein